MFARIFVLSCIFVVGLSWACDTNGEELTPTEQVSVSSAATTLEPASATPVPTASPTPVPTTLGWEVCKGILKEDGELVKVGEQYCVVQSPHGILVSIWPSSLKDAPTIAQAAGAMLGEEERCAQTTVYFFANLPDLGFPKIQVRDYVCS